MEAFFSNIFSYPTVLLTGLLLFMCFYWALAILGLIEIDVLDLDIDMDVDGDFDMDIEGFAGLMVTLGLTGVPLTVVLTILFLTAWTICFLIVHYFFGWDNNSILDYLFGTLVIIGSLAASIPITAKLIKPLRPVFRALYSPEDKKIFIGKTCIIRSTRVDENFGEANILVDGADIILKVRSDPKHGLKRGDKVLITEEIDGKKVYWVEPA